MNRQEMLDRLAKGESPIDVSIKKWQDIVDIHIENPDKFVFIDFGSGNCALCETSNEKLNCGDCPYLIFYGTDCMQNAFDRYAHAKTIPEAIKAAQDMVKELEAIKKEG